MTPERHDVSPPAPALLAYDRAGLAEALSVSLALIDTMNNNGGLPRPAELSVRCPRWPRREIEAWLLCGAPPRHQWEKVREQAIRKYANTIN